jgi:sugar O-acyltransferase (sialic acid O-acetyltransferase NeuD family)
MEIYIYGGGMLGKQVAHMIHHHLAEHYAIKGFIDDVQPQGTPIFKDLRVVGTLAQFADELNCDTGKARLAFGIGYSDMLARRQAFVKAKKLGFRFESLVHPNASVETSAILGEGTVALAGSVVDQYVTVGDICYMHNGSIIGENSVLGTNNYLSAGTTFGGSVTVGDDNFFGMNSIIVNDLTIGTNNFINSGSLVYKPLADNLRIVEFREQREVSNL